MNAEWIIGFLTGLLLVVVVSLIIRKVIRRRGGKPGEYDERQIAARGRAYAIAYYTLLIYLALWLVLSLLELPFFSTTSALLPGMLISLTVFVCYSIFHDAYFRCSDKPTIWLWAICAAGLVNLAIGVARLFRGGALAERLGENANLMVGAMLLVVLGCSLVKLNLDRQSEGE